MRPIDRLRHHVTGAIERGEAEAITEVPAVPRGAGIDYGRGMANVDTANGIRFGVIAAHALGMDTEDEFEAQYHATCPKCGRDADEPSAFGESFIAPGSARVVVPDDYTEERDQPNDFVCEHCKHFFGPESAYGDEPLGYLLDNAEYRAERHSDGDIFVTRSPFYTLARFCSPCAPGAGHLSNPDPDGVKTYCFGHDWFDDERAPYPVYRVSDDEMILAPSDMRPVAESHERE